MKDVCNVPDCQGKPHSRGVCPSHYKQWYKHNRFSEYIEKSKLLGVTERDHELYSVWQELEPMCKPWRENFWMFEYDVGKRPSEEHRLVRIDRTRDYEPGNVTWWYEVEGDYDS